MNPLAKDPYKQAAIAYAIYGIVYLIGAILELEPERKVTFMGFVPWWVFYVAGVAILASFPVVVWKGVRWFTLTLVFFTSGKAAWLCYLQGRRLSAGDPTNAYNWFFAVVALVAAVMLFRAGWPRKPAAGATA